MKRLKILLFSISTLMLLSVTTYGQIKPVIRDITNNHHFVMVVKSNTKFEKPERVVMNDFKASDKAFDPTKLSTYPIWRFYSVLVANKDGSTTNHVKIYNIDTKMYYHRSGIMKKKEEHDKVWEKDANNKYKSTFEERQNYYFLPEKKEGVFICFRIPNQQKKSLVVTPSTWNTREVKLVLVKL
ncbi:MAG: hypothetical protein U9R42_03290 [Bacteroidota bacterium]|nr:hypothetical protein [Bacteroidota bacterium]